MGWLAVRLVLVQGKVGDGITWVCQQVSPLWGLWILVQRLYGDTQSTYQLN